MSDTIQSVIEEAVDDFQKPQEAVEVEQVEDTPTEPEVVVPEATEEPAEAAPEGEPKAEADKTKKEPEDFDKKYGLDPTYPSGRENRIPYSRVKQITKKAVKDARKEWEAEHTPKFQEYETKVKDYESRLERVGRFEQVMMNQPDRFLEMLSKVPAYSRFFKAVEDAFAGKFEEGAPSTGGAAAPTSDMPQPDQTLSDGSKVYSMEGLKSLLEWQAAQVEQRVTKQVEERYKPIENEWHTQQRVQAVVPQIQAQIAEARTWPLFKESEAEITQALQKDRALSLEGAYRKVVFPKLQAERNRMREELVKEIKQAPRATSVPTSSVKAEPVESEARSLEDIIAAEVGKLKR